MLFECCSNGDTVVRAISGLTNWSSASHSIKSLFVLRSNPHDPPSPSSPSFSMSTHLAHKLPWESLGDVIQHKCVRNKGNHEVRLSLPQLKVVYHFGRCLSEAIKEFAATDNSSEAEKSRYDPANWGIDGESIGAYLGYYNSIVEGYVELNLILMDPKVFAPMLMGWQMRGTESMGAMCAGYNGYHPEWLAAHLRQAFTGQEMMMMMKVRYIKVLRETYNIRTRYLCYLGGFDLEESAAIAPKALFWRTTQCNAGVVVIGLALGSRVAAAS